MVTTIKSWTETLNDDLGSAVSMTVQYQNAMHELLQQFLAAGWTITWSTDGSSQGATNYWANPGDIVIAASGVAHSMIVLQAPVGWGNPTSGNAYHLFLSCEDSTGTNEFFFILHSSTITASSLTTKPATPTGAVGAQTLLFQWTVAAAGRASYWRTNTPNHPGDIFLFTKLLTSPNFTQVFAVLDPIYARGNNRGLILYSPVGLTSFHNASIGGTAQNASAAITPTMQTISTITASWTAGADANGEAGYFPIFCANNGTAQNARYYGYFPDVWGLSGSSSALWNFSDTNDSDPVILRGFNNVGLPVSSAAAALE